MQNIKLETITGSKTFDEIYKNGKKFYTPNAMAVVCFGKANESSLDVAPAKELIVKFAVSISKRNAKKAVVRNRVKRLLRVSLGIMFNNYFSDINSVSIEHLIISWRNAPVMPSLIRLKDVMPEIEEIFDKIINYSRSFYDGKHS